MPTLTSFGSSRAGIAAARLAEIVARSETGERLGTKSEVREIVQVSLGTFNETLRLLQERGLLTVRPGPGGGVFVAEQSPMARLGHALLGLNIDRGTVAEAVRIRNSLEYLTVEDACRYAGRGDIEAMHRSLRDMAHAIDSEDGIAFLRSNWDLHAKIAAAANSEILKSLYRSLLDLVEEHTISVTSADSVPLNEFHKARLAVHVELVDAIDNGDLQRAAEVVQRHNAGMNPRSRSEL